MTQEEARKRLSELDSIAKEFTSDWAAISEALNLDPEPEDNLEDLRDICADIETDITEIQEKMGWIS